MKEYMNLIEHLRGAFKGYNVGLTSDEELTEDVYNMMEANTAKILAFNQERVDKGLFITPLDVELLKEMLTFLKLDESRFSGMDIEKGYYNKIDALHLITDRWIRIYIQYYAELEYEKEFIPNNPQQEETQVIEPEHSCILPDKLIDNAVSAGLIKYSENGLRWMKTASLYGYFVDKVSEKLELKSSGGRIQWKVFRFIENHDTLLNTARQAVNDYTNKRLNPPEGDDIIDKILKDI